MVHTSNHCTQEIEAGGAGVEGQPGFHNEFQASLGYIARSCLKQQQGMRMITAIYKLVVFLYPSDLNM
jgi:hypothetical protein